ncbi:LysR family transcriptional regulator [Halomonas caseinilytica]|uniref:DNA-binding transcriptional regulator, LysR family n=1 Tax=Halomonas caseinilytica TaxID=438744 RepID=A0A1M6P9Y0_9GAMM|nr:LysR family transcriptional regulator [Halomonas caseinilytica]SEM21864.1 DNA-binding transcriptional regulator, LysR family [Halomonas caseinilytica]SHK04753.1 DNA-binding transcriptional regulator, LysR family [Halomonas caseinilytica]
MLDALTFDQLRTFVAVADSGSFRAGAARLARVQSGVSVAIANLEAQLEVSLFDRSGHRPILTPEGRALLENARDILLRVDAMRARAHGLGEGVELALPLVVDTLFPIHQVGKAMTETLAHYPSVAFRVDVEPLAGPLQALLDERCALAIMVGDHFRDPRVELEALSPVELVAVVASEHPLARHDEPLDSLHLADHLQIVQSDPSPPSRGRDFGVISTRTCRVNTQDTKHALILAGVGWGYLPVWQVERDLRAGRLAELAVRGRHGRRRRSDAYLARRVDAPFGPAARLLAEALGRRPD